MEKLILFAALIAFPFMWCGVLWVLAHLGVWSNLAERYPANAAKEGTAFYMRSGKVGMVNYGSCLTLTVSDSGLRLAVMLPFRTGHPPLFIPWSDFHDVCEKRVMFVLPFLQADIGNPVVARLLLPAWVKYHIPTTAT